MRLTVIGCSGSFPGPTSPASCYLVEVDDADGRTWRVLLDLGSGALGPLQHLVDLRDLDAVLISHLHPDHFMDLCGLFVALRYHPQGLPAVPVPVYGPRGTTDRLVSAYGPEMAEGLPSAFAVHTWDDATPVALGPLVVTPHRVNHPVEAYGMRIEHDGVVLGYSGDTDTCDGLIAVARDADLMLCEAAFEDGRDLDRGVHLTGARAGETAALAGAARLVLTHVPPWTDPQVVLAGARSTFAGRLELATPNAVYTPAPA